MPEAGDGLAGQSALVTGGSRGIGAGVAIALAAAGARVVVSGRDQAALDRVVATIVAAGGTALAIPAALTIEDEVAALRVAAAQAHGPVSLLVACAGGGGRAVPLAQQGMEDWRAVLDANLTSLFLTLRSFVPPMMAAARGAVVALSSSAGRQLSGASLPYAAAKSGVQSLVRQVAAEAAPHGVRINTIAPSAIVTERLAAAPASVRQEVAAGFPLRRIGEVGDVTDAALFLLGRRAGWITGITLDVAGGRVML